jgi:hypothetical protein
MNDAERYWDERAEQLRRFMGFCPLTPQEAEEALKKMPTPRKPSRDEIDSIVESVCSGELPDLDDPPAAEWSPDNAYDEIDSEAVLFRNEGPTDEKGDQIEKELLEELLNDEQSEDDAHDVED